MTLHGHEAACSVNVTVPTADAVATGEVSCYNCIVRLRSLPRFTETIGQGYVRMSKDTVLCCHAVMTVCYVVMRLYR